jgi:hypothetical protein
MTSWIILAIGAVLAGLIIGRAALVFARSGSGSPEWKTRRARGLQGWVLLALGNLRWVRRCLHDAEDYFGTITRLELVLLSFVHPDVAFVAGGFRIQVPDGGTTSTANRCVGQRPGFRVDLRSAAGAGHARRRLPGTAKVSHPFIDGMVGGQAVVTTPRRCSTPGRYPGCSGADAAKVDRDDADLHEGAG